jgi:hypothetical protein
MKSIKILAMALLPMVVFAFIVWFDLACARLDQLTTSELFNLTVNDSMWITSFLASWGIGFLLLLIYRYSD